MLYSLFIVVIFQYFGQKFTSVLISSLSLQCVLVGRCGTTKMGARKCNLTRIHANYISYPYQARPYKNSGKIGKHPPQKAIATVTVCTTFSKSTQCMFELPKGNANLIAKRPCRSTKWTSRTIVVRVLQGFSYYMTITSVAPSHDPNLW